MDRKTKIILGGAIAFVALTYIVDVMVRPGVVAKHAVEDAKARGKPVLNMGAGTKDSSVRSFLFGPTLWGDVNMDIATDNRNCASDNVCYGDINKIPYPDKYFGAVVASHVLEHLDNPDTAMAEMNRVADKVYPIVPKWWGPHTWAYYGHRWYISDKGKKIPLWQAKPIVIG